MVNSFWFKFALSIEEVNLITKKHVNETDFTVDIERESQLFSLIILSCPAFVQNHTQLLN